MSIPITDIDRMRSLREAIIGWVDPVNRPAANQALGEYTRLVAGYGYDLATAAAAVDTTITPKESDPPHDPSTQ
jgi:hypothetical protein